MSVVDLSHKDGLPISSLSPFPIIPANGLVPTRVDDLSRSEVEGAEHQEESLDALEFVPDFMDLDVQGVVYPKDPATLRPFQKCRVLTVPE